MNSDLIAAIAQSVIAEELRCYDQQDELLLESRCQGAHMAYVSARASRSPSDITCMTCEISFERSEMWFSTLQVSSAFREQGLGRQLVTAAERIACAVGLQVVNGFPLHSSRPFWEKMGYRAHPRIAHVLTKPLATRRTDARHHSGVSSAD